MVACREKGMPYIKRAKHIIMDQVSVRVDHSVRRKKKEETDHAAPIWCWWSDNNEGKKTKKKREREGKRGKREREREREGA